MATIDIFKAALSRLEPLKQGRLGLGMIVAAFVLNPAAGVIFGLVAFRFWPTYLLLAINSSLSSSAKWPVIPVLWLIIVGFFIVIHPFPPDDLAKSMVMWAYNYDYAKAYWSWPSHAPTFNIYILYDVAVSAIYQAFPKDYVQYSPLVVQFIALTAFLGVSIAVLRRRLAPVVGDRDYWVVILALSLLFGGVSGRLMMARPEIFMATWGLAALLARGRWAYLWAGIGFVLTPFYWLFGIYAAYALLLPNRSWLSRFAFAAAIGIFSVAFWYWYSNGEWLRMMLAGNISVGVEKDFVSEFASIFLAILIPGVTFLVGLLALYSWKQDRVVLDYSVLLVLLWFLLPNMVRYVSTVTPLLGVLAADAIARGYKDGELRNLLKYGSMALVLVLGISSMGQAKPPAKVEIPKEIQGKVFAAFNQSMYHGMFFNPGARFAPTQGIDWNTRSVIQEVKRLHNKNEVSCKYLRKEKVTAVVENLLVGPPPECLELVSSSREYHVWKVK